MSIFEAALHGTLDELQREVDACNDINSLNDDGFTALFYAVHSGSHEKAMLLLDAGADPLAGDGPNGLSEAATSGHVDLVAEILDRGVPADAVCVPGGWTPLMYAALRNRVSVIQLLLERGANPNYVDDEGRRAIDNAAGRPSQGAFAILFPLTDKSYQRKARRDWPRPNSRVTSRHLATAGATPLIRRKPPVEDSANFLAPYPTPLESARARRLA